MGCIRLVGGSTELRKAKLGWIVVGEFIRTTRRAAATCNVITNNLEQQISKFWELEERPIKRHLSREERDCENHYTQHTRRDADSGRYAVRLPFKDNLGELGESYSIASKRFLSLERQLNRNPQVKEQCSLKNIRSWATCRPSTPSHLTVFSYPTMPSRKQTALLRRYES